MFKNTFEKKILNSSLIIGLLLAPIIFFGKDYRKWIFAFLINSYANTFIAPILAYKHYLKYPVRFFPSIYKSSILYDYLICSLITSVYCKASFNDNFYKAFAKVWLFATPQALLERWFEKNTDLIKYSKGWTWIHSLITIALAKFSIRSIIHLCETKDKSDQLSDTEVTYKSLKTIH